MDLPQSVELDPALSSPPAAAASRQLMRRVVVLGLISVIGISMASVLAVTLALKQLQYNLNDAGNEAQQTFNRQLFGVRQDLLATSQSIALSPQQVRGLLRGVLDRQEVVFELMVLDFEGKVLEHRRRVSSSSVVEEVALEPAARKALQEGELWYGPVKLAGEAAFPFVDLLLPVPGDSGEAAKVLRASVELSSLWSKVTDQRVGKGGRVFIIAADGRLLVHTDLNLVRGNPPPMQLAGTSVPAAAEKELLYYRTRTGQWMLARVMALEDMPWYAVAELPINEAWALFFGFTVLLLLVGVLALLVLHIVHFTRRRIVAPLAELQQGVDAFAQGNLYTRIGLRHNDELGALGRTFNHMAGQLQRTIDTLHEHVRELKTAQEALREAHDELEQRVRDRTAALQAANDEMRGLVYIVSHDLRAPLINLKGFAGELRATLGDVRSALDAALEHLDAAQRQELRLSLEQEVPEALSYIDSSVVRMDGFIEALLRLSRTGHRELLPEAVDVAALVRKILESLAYQIEQAQAQVVVDELLPVEADAMAMEQILGNLLTNALTYRDPDRSLRIEISSERDAEKTLYRVQDTGRGIAADSLNKVFLPFRRVGHQNAPGEGMGLAYAQALVRRHGGRIWCQSKVGEGSVFQFTIPHQLSTSPTADLADMTSSQPVDSARPVVGF